MVSNIFCKYYETINKSSSNCCVPGCMTQKNHTTENHICGLCFRKGHNISVKFEYSHDGLLLESSNYVYHHSCLVQTLENNLHKIGCNIGDNLESVNYSNLLEKEDFVYIKEDVPENRVLYIRKIVGLIETLLIHKTELDEFVSPIDVMVVRKFTERLVCKTVEQIME